jgi:ketosteroid isomerase-like protein
MQGTPTAQEHDSRAARRGIGCRLVHDEFDLMSTALAQMSVINQRVIHAGMGTGGEPIEALIHADFMFTRGDGAWLSRADFIAHVRQRAAPDGVALEHETVRIFGPLGLVHGLFTSAATGPIRYTDAHLRNGRAWQLVSAQDTPLKQGVARAMVTGTAPVRAAWQGQDPAGDDNTVLTALNERYVRAFREADVAWYDAHLAPDCVVISSDGSCKDRAAALADFARPVFAESMKSFPVDRVQVRRFAEVALIHATNVFELKDGRIGENRYTDVWVRHAARWRCVAAHITTHRAPSQPR